VPFLAENPRRAEQARAAGWDLLIVDEAHHLTWSPDAPSASYQLVEGLAAQTPGVLLLTATPQQLGPEGHFARLRLLDPNRYADLGEFLKEATHYERVAEAVDRLLEAKALSPDDEALFSAKSERIRRHLEELAAGDADARQRLIPELLDAFGTGRVMFRNTRAALSGFPEREAHLIPLDVPAGAAADAAKIKWLATFLKKLEAKVLLICRTRALAEQIHEQLLRELNVNAGLFHEGLTLLQRDRNAAYFSEADGARILICSEIGSEGRNFQFAHHLVLYDLPADPELLEQRIGRLDRIGQTATIQIHVPYLRESEAEVLARWYHEGLGAFEKNLHGAAEIAHTLAEELAALRESFDAKRLKAFLARSKKLRSSVAKKLERGHDRLLELNSCRPERAQKIIDQIRVLDADVAFEEFFSRLLDHFGVHVEELGSRSFLLLPGHLITDAFPSLPAEGMSVTFDRARALSREDLGFMSGDHPLVGSSFDLLLASEAGNSAFAIWRATTSEAVLLEVYIVVECVAPAALHVDRFLPATPVRIVVDHALADKTDDPALLAAQFETGDVFKLLDRGAVKRKLLPAMLEKVQAFAAERMQELTASASGRIERQLQGEIDRLEDLRRINDHVRPEEIAAAKEQKAALLSAVATANFRLDAVRLILGMPA
jgi:ATP-dependent helicase HepA